MFSFWLFHWGAIKCKVWYRLHFVHSKSTIWQSFDSAVFYIQCICCNQFSSNRHAIAHLIGLRYRVPDSKVHVANMGPIWGQQDPGGPHVGPRNFAIWDVFCGFNLWFIFCPNHCSDVCNIWLYRTMLKCHSTVIFCKDTHKSIPYLAHQIKVWVCLMSVKYGLYTLHL